MVPQHQRITLIAGVLGAIMLSAAIENADAIELSECASALEVGDCALITYCYITTGIATGVLLHIHRSIYT
jgi:hypothetical protein